MRFKDVFTYCPACGARRFQEYNFKSKQCDECGFVYYYNPSAAVAAFVLNEKGELLVCRRAKDPVKGTYDLPGGFVDYAETAEQAVVRELQEETSLILAPDSVSYLFSFPNTYPYCGLDVYTLDLFFLCHIEGRSILQAADDVAECFFLPLNEIRPDDFGLDSIRQAVATFLQL